VADVDQELNLFFVDLLFVFFELPTELPRVATIEVIDDGGDSQKQEQE